MCKIPTLFHDILLPSIQNPSFKMAYISLHLSSKDKLFTSTYTSLIITVINRYHLILIFHLLLLPWLSKMLLQPEKFTNKELLELEIMTAVFFFLDCGSKFLFVFWSRNFPKVCHFVLDNDDEYVLYII